MTDQGDLIVQQTVIAALNNMFKQDHVSICTIRQLAKILDVNYECRAYDVLRSLHCVNFADMEKELRDSIPGLINEVLFNNPVGTFRVQVVRPPVNELSSEITDIKSSVTRKGLGWFKK